MIVDAGPKADAETQAPADTVHLYFTQLEALNQSLTLDASAVAIGEASQLLASDHAQSLLNRELHAQVTVLLREESARRVQASSSLPPSPTGSLTQDADIALLGPELDPIGVSFTLMVRTGRSIEPLPMSVSKLRQRQSALGPDPLYNSLAVVEHCRGMFVRFRISGLPSASSSSPLPDVEFILSWSRLAHRGQLLPFSQSLIHLWHAYKRKMSSLGLTLSPPIPLPAGFDGSKDLFRRMQYALFAFNLRQLSSTRCDADPSSIITRDEEVAHNLADVFTHNRSAVLWLPLDATKARNALACYAECPSDTAVK